MLDAYETLLPSTDEKDNIDMIRRFMVKSDQYRRNHIDLAMAARTLYQCWVSDGRSETFRANIRLPYAFGLIESEVPQIVEALFGERPFATVEGNEIQDTPWEDPLTDFLDVQVENMRLPVKAIPLVKACLLDGTAIAKVPWRIVEQEVEQKRKVVNDVGDVEDVVDRFTRIAYDGPDIEQVDIVDFFPHWSIREPGEIQKMPGLVSRSWATLQALEEKGYKNLEKLRYSLSQKQDQGLSTSAWSSPYFADGGKSFLRDLKNDNPANYKTMGMIELWEYWGKAKVDGKVQEARILVANGDVELECLPNPSWYKFKPFVAVPNVPRTNEFYGVPELLPVKGILKEANVLRNARLDNVNLSVNAMYVVDRAAGIKAQNLISRPSGVIFANDINGVKRLDPPTTDPIVYREVTEIQQEAKDALGILAGAPALTQAAKTFGRSATGVQYINNVSASRVALKTKLFGELMLKPLYRMMLMWDAQFILDEQWIRVSDPEAVNPFTILPPDAFQSAVDFKIKVNYDTGGRDAEFAKLQQFLQVAQVAEATQPGIVKWDVVNQAFGRSLWGARNRKFMRTPEEMQAMQAQQLATQQAAEQVAGAVSQGAQPPMGGPTGGEA